MKTVYIISIFSLLMITSCNKEENSSGSGDPFIYTMFLDLQREDGTSFNEGEIEAKAAYINEDGELIFRGDWYPMSVASNYYIDIFGKTVFGPIDIGISTVDYNPEPGTEFVSNEIYLLRYDGNTEMDTLRIRDSSRYQEFRYFDIFKNDSLLVRLNDIEAPWKVTIQK